MNFNDMRLQYGADFSFVCILLHVQCLVYAQTHTAYRESYALKTIILWYLRCLSRY